MTGLLQKWVVIKTPHCGRGYLSRDAQFDRFIDDHSVAKVAQNLAMAAAPLNPLQTRSSAGPSPRNFESLPFLGQLQSQKLLY